jgi:hypothetical protein
MAIGPITAVASVAPVARARAVMPESILRARLAASLQEQRLQEIDAEVRAHEHAHVAALGSGVITYETVIGPDGRSYAVGGGVPVDLEPVPGDPAATVRKAERIIQAAYAPGMPSAADQRVAAEAYQMEVQAQHELDRTEGQRSWIA